MGKNQCWKSQSNSKSGSVSLTDKTNKLLKKIFLTLWRHNSDITSILWFYQLLKTKNYWDPSYYTMEPTPTSLTQSHCFISFYLLNHICVLCQSLSRVWLFVTPWTGAHQAPLSMEFSRREYWNGLPCPSPGDLPNSRIELKSPSLQADSLPPKPPGKPCIISRKSHLKVQFWLPLVFPQIVRSSLGAGVIIGIQNKKLQIV